jgi:hypothetical protein
LTVDAAALRTSGSRAIRDDGGPTSAGGPSMLGNGSNRASALRNDRGGKASFSRLRISERWMSRRYSRAPGVWSAIAPSIHATPSPAHASRIAPATWSASPNRPRTLRRSW